MESQQEQEARIRLTGCRMAVVGSAGAVAVLNNESRYNFKSIFEEQGTSKAVQMGENSLSDQENSEGV
jgi:hypothetical protein